MPKIIISSLVALTIVFIGGWDVQPTHARVKYIYVPITGQSQMFGAFGDPFLSSQVGSTPVDGYYLQTDGINSTWAEVISSGGGSGSGTFSTTTTGGLLQYPYTTLTTSLDTNSTSTSKWWFNPELNRTVMTGRLGIGTTSPYAPLSVVGQVVASYFTATGTTASFFPLANITKLSNLTGNGFVKTSSSDGTLSVDTTTYESGLTAGDGLTRTGNDFDFDGGASPAGDLGGTWASPTVDDDSHAHTGATISGIDISDDTNLSGDTEIVLTGDALSIASTITRDTELSSYVPTSRQLTINGTAYDLSADRTWTISSGGTGNVATSTNETAGNLTYWTSTNSTPATVGKVATTTLVAGSNITLSATPVIIGSSPITISASGGGGGTQKPQYYILATSTSMTTDFCQYASTTAIVFLQSRISSSNITETFSNTSECVGGSLFYDVVAPITGVIGSTTFAGVSWNGNQNPGSMVTNGLIDRFYFVNTAASSTGGSNFITGKYDSSF